MRLALQLNHPVYGCLYLTLATRLGTFVVTADTGSGKRRFTMERMSGSSGSCPR